LGGGTGGTITLINSLSHKAGVGLATALGGGSNLYYGVQFAKNLGIAELELAGVFIYHGSGDGEYVGCNFAHQNAILGWYMAGGAIFNGGGNLNIIGTDFSHNFGMDNLAGIAGDVFFAGKGGRARWQHEMDDPFLRFFGDSGVKR
jgi:hypothetical protein